MSRDAAPQYAKSRGHTPSLQLDLVPDVKGGAKSGADHWANNPCCANYPASMGLPPATRSPVRPDPTCTRRPGGRVVHTRWPCAEMNAICVPPRRTGPTPLQSCPTPMQSCPPPRCAPPTVSELLRLGPCFGFQRQGRSPQIAACYVWSNGAACAPGRTRNAPTGLRPLLVALGCYPRRISADNYGFCNHNQGLLGLRLVQRDSQAAELVLEQLFL
jgi:hypothetical protein